MRHASPLPVSSELLMRLRADNPTIAFSLGDTDRWDSRGTVYYTAGTPAAILLHELAHALLNHHDYQLDIELLRIERAAWHHARTVLAPRYHVTIDTNDEQAALDTYRDWLHNRSLCPDCAMSGVQQSDQSYVCVVCRITWTANAAKTCALRRLRQPALS